MGRWVLLGGVALVALVIGIVVTGLPDSVPSDVLRSDISPPSTTTTLPPTTARRTTTTSTSTSTSTSTAPATTLSASTASPGTTAAPTPSAPTTAPRTTTTLTPAASVRVVIANAGEADDLAARTAPVLRRLGYENVVISTANARQSTTMVWYGRGMEHEARALASAVGIADGQVRARPRGRVTEGGERGDLWLVVGHGRPPLIEAAML